MVLPPDSDSPDSLWSCHFPITISTLLLPAAIHCSLYTGSEEKWFLSKYPFRGAQVWAEPHGSGLERKISINIGTLSNQEE